MAPWKLPLIVAAIAVPTAFAFAAGGPGVGVAVGALVAVAIVVVAVRQRPREAIVAARAEDSRPRLLVVVSRPVDESSAVQAIAREARSDDPESEAEVRVLAPARIGFLDRWASDLEAARHAAQQNLVITVASLAKADVAAEARVGDEDLVQAVEDELGSFAATEVVLATGGPDEDPAGNAAARELASRLEVEFRHLTLRPRDH